MSPLAWISAIVASAVLWLGATIAAVAGDPIADWLGRATGPVVLAFVVLALMNRWLITGREGTMLREERDKALDLVIKQAEIAQRALEAAATERKR